MNSSFNNIKIYKNLNDYLFNNLSIKSSILQIGALDGKFAEYLLLNYDPFSLHIVDTFQKYNLYEKEIKDKFKKHKIVKIHKGYGYRFMVTIRLNRLEDFDLIYLNLENSYIEKFRELSTAITLLSKNGVIAINNYFENLDNESTRAVNDFLKINSNFYIKAFSKNVCGSNYVYLSRL